MFFKSFFELVKCPFAVLGHFVGRYADIAAVFGSVLNHLDYA